MGSIKLGSDLLDYIIACDLQPGETLPPIKELASADHLNISTSKVREQLEVARAMGLVEVRSRTGTKLQKFSFTPVTRLALLYALARDLTHFEMFHSLRIHIETAYWDEACRLLDDTSLEVMQAAVHSAQAKLSSTPIRIPFIEHRTFHLTVFQRLENPFVLGILEAYWDAYDTVALNQYADYTYLREVWDYHARILDAIRAGDFQHARQTFIDHTRLLSHTPQTKPETRNNHRRDE